MSNDENPAVDPIDPVEPTPADPVAEPNPVPEQDNQPAEEFDIVSFGEAPPATSDHESAPEWVRELRKEHRDLVRKNRELEARLQQQPAQASAPADQPLGQKPTLESCDWDADRLGRDLDAWYVRKAKAEADESARRAAEQQAQAEWQQRAKAFFDAKAALRVPDFDEAEEAFAAALDVNHQAIVLRYSDNPAAMVYAIGRDPATAKRLAAIQDGAALAKEIGKLETQLTVTAMRKNKPQPEQVPPTSGGLGTGADSTIDKLRAEAEKSGDYTKVIAYKRQARR